MTSRRTARFAGSAAVALTLALGGCASTTSGTPSAAETGNTPPAADVTSTSAPSTPTGEQTSEEPEPPVVTPSGETRPTETQQTGAPQHDTTETYVYYVVDTRSGLRLARETRDVPTGSGGAIAAIEAMIAGAADPDYSTTWNPATLVRGATAEDGVISVDLSAGARTANVGSGGAAMMVQQLVWTATEAFAAPEAAVRLTVDGAPAGELWGVLDWDVPIGREAAADVRTLVQIDTPREGAEVRSPVTISGDAAAFEANVPWRVLDRAGTEVASGFTMTAEGMRHAPFSFQVDLPPGGFTVEIREDDPSDGEGGMPDTDTRTITVLP